MNAYLILEDGSVFEGEQFGSSRSTVCEIVFNTSMTGYLELLTDPSYAGQGIVMTYPLIGNYGIFKADAEAKRPWAEAFIVRENARFASNFRNEMSLNDYLVEHGIPGIAGLDTRALTKLLREKGTMRGMVTCDHLPNLDEALSKIKNYQHQDLVERVSCEETIRHTGAGAKIALLDYGAKRSMITAFIRRGCDVTVYPAHSSAREILDAHPDGVMLTNGPGDPKECKEIIREVSALYQSGVPLFAICLGHQLLALANGFDTHKMKYGHRGGNHPVRNTHTGRTTITAQNHGYVVTRESVDPKKAEVLFENVNDGTVEGLLYGGRVMTVQFHPEASPGPKDSDQLFDDFLKRAGGAK